MAKIICVDFDGVLHSYTSGWKGIDVIPDPPVPGALEWLHMMCNDPDYKIVVYSSRSKEEAGRVAMSKWLDHHLKESLRPSISQDSIFDRVEFATEKPAAYLTIDDRAICFRGTFPSKQEIVFFKPWNKA